jgi:hypothetical protein
LAEIGGELLHDGARLDIGTAARSVAYEHAHRTIGIRLRLRRRTYRQQQRSEEKPDPARQCGEDGPAAVDLHRIFGFGGRATAQKHAAMDD